VSDRDIISWATLNAYVDGELTPDAAAKVAAALVLDREAAAQVATLTRLRAAVRAAEPQEPAPPFMPPRPKARKARWVPLVAAALVAVSAGLAAIGLMHPRAMDAPLSNAIAAHRAWLSEPPQEQRRDLSVALAGADVGSLPDLSLASLNLVHLSVDMSTRDGRGLLAGYIGPNGCRVGLWIAPLDNALPMQPAVRDSDGVAIRAWRGQYASYALLGQGINKVRFDGIAALVARITGGERDIPREQVAALAEARNARPPCIG
jgi:anti-sigma factor RsiW